MALPAKVTLKVNFRASATRTRMGANPTPRPWRSRSGYRPPSQRVRASSRMSWQWSGSAFCCSPSVALQKFPAPQSPCMAPWTNSYGQIANPACRRRSRGRFRRRRRRSFFKGMPLGWEPAKSIITIIKLCTRQARQLPRLRSRRVVRFDIHRILIKIKKTRWTQINDAYEKKESR